MWIYHKSQSAPSGLVWAWNVYKIFLLTRLLFRVFGVPQRSAIGIFTLHNCPWIGASALEEEVTQINKSTQVVMLSKTKHVFSLMVPSYLAVCILSLIEVTSQGIRKIDLLGAHEKRISPFLSEGNLTAQSQCGRRKSRHACMLGVCN